MQTAEAIIKIVRLEEMQAYKQVLFAQSSFVIRWMDEAGHLHTSSAVELDTSWTYGQLCLVMVHSQAPSRPPP